MSSQVTYINPPTSSHDGRPDVGGTVAGVKGKGEADLARRVLSSRSRAARVHETENLGEFVTRSHLLEILVLYFETAQQPLGCPVSTSPQSFTWKY